MKKIRALSTITLLFICQLIISQNIGVQVNVNLTPPYTLSLHDYTQAGSNKLRVSILLKDLNYPLYQGRLRVTIEGSGFTLTTRANYVPPPINLQGGIPSILGSEDLEAYFLPENLDFNGLNKSDYLRTRKLPEGFYRFYIEVLDYNRGSLVSNKGMAMAYIVLNEPPIINLPANNTKLPSNDPQNIFFNWTPLHLGSPNSAFSSLYEFRLYEIQPKGRSPYEAIRTSNPIYESVPALTTTSFQYNVAMPSLIPGNQYAFTIRAVDREGRDLFKNNGYSEVFMFTWGDECKSPAGIEAKAVSGGGIELKWKQAPAHTAYNIQYRTKGSGTWYTQNSFLDNTSIYELPGNTDIEYQIQSVCGGYQSDYSETLAIKTKEEEQRTFACGSGKELNTISNTNPKATLKVGDRFTAGGYTAVISKVSGQNGSFTGECHVLVPFFNLARVPHKFDNIKINELNQMYEGKLVSIYNPDSKFLARVEGAEKKPEEIAVVNNDSTGTKSPGNGIAGVIETKGDTTATSRDSALAETQSSGNDSSVVVQNSNGASKNRNATTNSVVSTSSGNNVVGNSASNNAGNSSGGTENSTIFESSFEKTEYPYLIDKSIKPKIAIKHNLTNKANYKLKLVENDHNQQILVNTEQRELSETLEYVFQTPGQKDIEIHLLDKNDSTIRISKASTKVIAANDFNFFVSDAKSPKRKAGVGETLYLVNDIQWNPIPTKMANPVRNVNLETSPINNYKQFSKIDLQPGAIKWGFIDDQKQPIVAASNFNNKLFTQVYHNSFNDKGTITGNLGDKSKEINIQCINGRSQTIKFTSENDIKDSDIKNKALRLKKLNDKLFTLLNKIPGAQPLRRTRDVIAKPERGKLTWTCELESGMEFTAEEIKQSPSYLKENTTYVSVFFGVEGDVFFPYPYSFEFPLKKPVVKVGAYVGFEGGVELTFKLLNEEVVGGKVKDVTSFETEFKGKIIGKIGGKIEVLTKAVEIKAAIWGQAGINIIKTTVNKNGVDEFYIIKSEPITLNIEGEVKVDVLGFDFETGPWQYNYVILEEIPLLP